MPLSTASCVGAIETQGVDGSSYDCGASDRGAISLCSYKHIAPPTIMSTTTQLRGESNWGTPVEANKSNGTCGYSYISTAESVGYPAYGVSTPSPVPQTIPICTDLLGASLLMYNMIEFEKRNLVKRIADPTQYHSYSMLTESYSMGDENAVREFLDSYATNSGNTTTPVEYFAPNHLIPTSMRTTKSIFQTSPENKTTPPNYCNTFKLGKIMPLSVIFSWFMFDHGQKFKKITSKFMESEGTEFIWCHIKAVFDNNSEFYTGEQVGEMLSIMRKYVTNRNVFIKYGRTGEISPENLELYNRFKNIASNMFVDLDILVLTRAEFEGTYPLKTFQTIILSQLCGEKHAVQFYFVNKHVVYGIDASDHSKRSKRAKVGVATTSRNFTNQTQYLSWVENLGRMGKELAADAHYLPTSTRGLNATCMHYTVEGANDGVTAYAVIIGRDDKRELNSVLALL